MNQLLTTDVHGAIEVTQRLSDLFAQRREQLARAVGLTVAEWAALEQISEEHFMPSMFAKSRESSAAAVSKILRQLLNKGLVAVAVDKADGRQRRYALTARGRRTMESLRRRRERAIEAIWMDMDPEALERFTEFSRDLAARLEAYAQREDH